MSINDKLIRAIVRRYKAPEKRKNCIEAAQENHMIRKTEAVHSALIQAGILTDHGSWRWGYHDEVCMSNPKYPHLTDVFRVRFLTESCDDVIVESIEDLGSSVVMDITRPEPTEEEMVSFFSNVLDNNSDFICQLNVNIEDAGSCDVFGHALNGGESLSNRQCHALERVFQMRGYIVKLVDYDRGIFTLEFPLKLEE